ncbi:MAG: hypothetical protein M1133_14040 [Armatimonadetes bacterium]|nr:hypothetical protein [Armatimonadota bacterium]
MAVQLIESPEGSRVHIPLNLKRTSGRKRIVTQEDLERQPLANAHCTAYRNAMLIAIARGFRWRKLLDEGRYMSIHQMADALGVVAPYMSRLIRLTLLAPDIIEAIVDGREPDGMSIEQLRRPMPLSWGDQQALFMDRDLRG